MKHLKSWIKDRRKEVNTTYGRADDFGRGLKAGLDMALEAAKELEKGGVYDEFSGSWIRPTE